MSWFARSLTSSVKQDDDDDDEQERGEDLEHNHNLPGNLDRGVREDLSDLTKTLTRQFWGVASFLAPPPVPNQSFEENSSNSLSNSSSPTIDGIRNDFAEIGGKFKTGISRLSSNKAVTEISKIASSFLPFGTDVDDDGSEDSYQGPSAAGITEEVLTFARNIAMHPETWLDFPLLGEDEDTEDFDMSEAQEEHALAIESLAPSLAALRIELCPTHISEGLFWKIYFVLLHPRLNLHDGELLSTPQIVEARSMMLQKLQKQSKQEPERYEVGTSHFSEDIKSSSVKEQFKIPSNFNRESCSFEPITQSPPITDEEIEKHPIMSTLVTTFETKVGVDSLNESSTLFDQTYEEDEDEWLEDAESGEPGSFIPFGNEEDVSFSDLEEDTNNDSKLSVITKSVTDSSDYPPNNPPSNQV